MISATATWLHSPHSSLPAKCRIGKHGNNWFCTFFVSRLFSYVWKKRHSLDTSRHSLWQWGSWYSSMIANRRQRLQVSYSWFFFPILKHNFIVHPEKCSFEAIWIKVSCMLLTSLSFSINRAQILTVFLTRLPLSRQGRPTGIWITGSASSAPGAGVC